MLSGLPLVGKQTAYLGYEALLALHIAATGTPATIVFLQVIASAAAVVGLFALGRHFGGPLAGFLAAVFYAANPEILRWNAYILTDALYTSALVLIAWAWLRGRTITAGLLIALAVSLRPTGWILPFAVCAVVFTLSRRRRLVALLAAVLYAAIFFTWPPARQAVQREDPEDMLARGVVIWGYEPANLAMPTVNRPAADWRAGILYGIAHPWPSIRLALHRVGAEVLHARPYYSPRRNAMIAVMLAVLYPGTLIGVWRYRRDAEMRWLLAMIIAHLALVAVTFADWDGRFLVHILPLVGVSAAAGWASVAERLHLPGTIAGHFR